MRASHGIADLPIDLVDRLGQPLSSYPNASGEYQFCCIFCPEGDTHFHLYYNPSKNRFICHRCDTAGNIVRLRRLLGLPLGTRRHVSLLQKAKEYLTEGSKHEPTPKVVSIDITECTRPIEKQDYAYQYAKSNWRFNSRQIREYDFKVGIGWFGKQDLRNRLVFPDFNEEGECIYYSARAYFDHMYPKYLNPPCSFKSLLLYNMRRAMKHKEIIITEGVASCIIAGDNAIALYGKDASPNQIDLLVYNWDSVVIALDGDAVDKAIELAEKLKSVGMKVRIVDMPLTADPASLGSSQFSDMVKEAEEYSWAIVARMRLRRTRNDYGKDFSTKNSGKPGFKRHPASRTQRTFHQ